MIINHVKKDKSLANNLAEVVNSLQNHPAIKSKLDSGLNGTQQLDQFAGLVIERYQENVVEVEDGKERDDKIHIAYDFLSREYPYLVPRNLAYSRAKEKNPISAQREEKQNSYKALYEWSH